MRVEAITAPKVSRSSEAALLHGRRDPASMWPAAGIALVLSWLRARVFWVLPAAATLVICLIDIGRPALWQDELATYSAARRPLLDLVRLLRHGDAVLAPYYLLLHGWIGVVGDSPTALRLPSALAMAGSAGLTAALAARLFGRWEGCVAGLTFGCLPVVSRYGQEARPYALAVLLVAGTAFLLVVAVQRQARADWVRYGLGIAALGAVQLTTLLVLVPHLLVVLVERRQVRAPTALVRSWGRTVALALLAVSPIAVVGWRQRGQISWIPPLSLAQVQALPGQVFGSSAVAELVLVVAVVGVLRFRGRTLLAASLLLVPPVLLVVLSEQVPLVRPRYLIHIVVGAAVLAAVGACALGRRAAVIFVVAVALLGLPAQVDVRSATRAGQPDYPEIAALLHAQVRPGDALVMPGSGGLRFRVGVAAYLPRRFRPEDPLLRRSALDAARLDGVECSPATCLGRPPRVWVACVDGCRTPEESLLPETREVLRREGYEVAHSWRLRGAELALEVPRVRR